MNTLERAKQYLNAIPGAVSGQGGHATTFKVACTLVHGFAMSEPDALDVVRGWNAKCTPPWPESDLVHKVRSAATASHSTARGHLLGSATPAPARSGSIAPAPSPLDRLKARAERSLPVILKENACGLADFWEESPINLAHHNQGDYNLFIETMFAPEDVVWIGQPQQSGQPNHVKHFRTRDDWLASPAIIPCGNFTCASTFKPGSYSRSLVNKAQSPFFVAESDSLSIADQCAVFKWMRGFMRLRAVVYSGGKSLHAWFDRPSNAVLVELRAILPCLKLDPASSRDVQPLRLPGAFREDKDRWQNLHYLAPAKQEGGAD